VALDKAAPRISLRRVAAAMDKASRELTELIAIVKATA
jgi:hypothetical protein